MLMPERPCGLGFFTDTFFCDDGIYVLGDGVYVLGFHLT